MTNKKHELQARVYENDPDVIGLAEIAPKNATFTIQPVEMEISGYGVYYSLIGRGVALYVRNGLRVTEVGQESAKIPAVWCEIVLSTRELVLVGIIYRSPNATDEEDAMMRENIRFNVGRKHNHLILMGDYNYPGIDWREQMVGTTATDTSEEFLTLIQDLFLHQAVNDPTHYRGQQTANILDLVFTEGDETIETMQHSEPVGKSHHEVLTWCVVCRRSRPTTKTIKYCYDRGDYSEMRRELVDIDWEGILQDKSLEDMWTCIKEKVAEVSKKYIPRIAHRSDKTRQKPPPWISPQLRKVLGQKKNAFRQYRRTRDEADYSSYKKWRNKAKSEMREALRNYEKSIVEGSKRNPKLFYKYVNNRIKGKSSIPNIVRGDGQRIDGSGDKAEEFNKFFTSVFTKEDQNQKLKCQEIRCDTSFDGMILSKEEVRKALLTLNPDKSSGPDGIHPKVLRECAMVLDHPLYLLFNKSVEDGKIPQDWKTANISPIHKKGSKSEVGNYRPISLTSCICKVLERLIRKSLLEHLFNNELISERQHGFLPGRSCSTQLLEMMDYCTEILDRGGSMDIIYFDLAKAFDSVPHRRLLEKLGSCGVRGAMWSWMEDFLVGRQQRVMVDGEVSGWTGVDSGVPQGSVLGPIMFLCYINDMPGVVEAMLYLYADDAKALREISSNEDVCHMQKDVDGLQQWADDLLLKFNKAKCKVLHLGTKNIKGKYYLNGPETTHEIESSELERDLGILVDSKLKFDSQIAQAASKGNQILGLIKRTFVYKDMYTVKKLYTALVRPHLEYGNIIWSPRFKKDIDRIERVQRRATRMVEQVKQLPYEERLARMELPSLVYRRYRGDMIEVYKYLNGKSYASRDILPMAHDTCVRGHRLKLLKRHCKSGLRQSFFSYRVVNKWNTLPEEIVIAPSLNIFKNLLDKYWREDCYGMDPEAFGRRRY